MANLTSLANKWDKLQKATERALAADKLRIQKAKEKEAIRHSISIGKLTEKEKALEIKFRALWGGKGKATSPENLDADAAGCWRNPANRKNPSRSSFVLYVLCALVTGKIPADLSHNKTFQKLQENFVENQQLSKCAADFADLSESFGMKYPDLNPGQRNSCWNGVFQALVTKGFLERVGYGSYAYTGKSFPRLARG